MFDSKMFNRYKITEAKTTKIIPIKPNGLYFLIEQNVKPGISVELG